MNKQEEIKTIKAEWFSEVGTNLKDITDIINMIDEPQKVVVPKFVAEWYERNKDDLDPAIYSTITGTYRKLDGENNDLLGTFERWLLCEYNSILTLVQMHLFGYEIEQEQLYTVEIPNPNSKGKNKIYLCKDDNTGKVYLCKGNFNPSKNRNLKLTEAEIRKDFEWAWQFAVPVEVGNDIEV